MRYGMLAATAWVAAVLAGCQMPAKRGTDDLEVLRKDCIETRCVVAYYTGTTPYWTESRQRFCPSSLLFEAWGAEPEGVYQAAYSRGQFSASGLDRPAIKALPAGLMNAPLAELTYYSFTAGAGFEPERMTAADTARIEGQRYEAFEVKGGAGRTVTLYRNPDGGHYELVRVADGKGLDWLARSYNPRYSSRFNRAIPRKIDIFDIQQGIASKKLLIQFDYIDVQ